MLIQYYPFNITVIIIIIVHISSADIILCARIPPQVSRNKN